MNLREIGHLDHSATMAGNLDQVYNFFSKILDGDLHSPNFDSSKIKIVVDSFWFD